MSQTFKPFDYQLPMIDHLLANDRAALFPCSFCGYEMEEDLGKYGCPNCHGNGLEKKMKSSYLFSCVP
jgi:rubrerythrin